MPLAAILLLAGCGASKRTVSRDNPNGSGGTAGSTGAESGGAANSDGEGGEASSSGGTAGRGGSSGGGSGGTAGSPPEPECGVIPGTSQIPRLTNKQYDRTVEQLLGVVQIEGEPPSASLAPDDRGPMTEIGWAAYLAVGEAIAAQVLSTPDLRSRFVSCADEADATTCLRDSVLAFGRSAFRRPLTAAEVARFDKIIAAGAEITETGSLDEVAEVVLQTFLVSPSFLQRSEISLADDGMGRFTLSAHEVASRLSYMLWQGPPDEALNQAADAGELATKEQIRAQAERLLADPKSHDFVTSFHRFYLGNQPGSRWDLPEKNPERFASFTAPARTAMIAEMDRYFEQLVFEHDAPFQELFLSPLAYVNADTAPFYGLNSSDFGSLMNEVSLDPAQRPGFLTRAGFLSAYSGWNDTNPIARGIFIGRKILGVQIDTPEHNVMPTPPSEALTNRERITAMTAAPACAGCHGAIVDPPGFVLEAYDPVGAWQTIDPDSGAPIDTAADVIIDGSPVSVSGPAELMRAIASSRSAQEEYARRWVSFAYERDVHPADACDVERIGSQLVTADYTIRDLIVDLTQSESFRSRALEQDP